MKIDKNKHMVTIVISLLIIAAAILMLIFTLGNYKKKNVQAFDEALWYTSDVLDYNISNTLKKFGEDLEFSVTREDFLYAETVWKQDGNSEILLESMKSSSLTNRGIFQAMIAINPEGVFLSTDDDTSYEIGEKLHEDIYACKGPEGEDCIAFLYEVDNRLAYAGVCDLNLLYTGLIGKVVGMKRQVMLADSSGSIVLYKKYNKAAYQNLMRCERDKIKVTDSYYIKNREEGSIPQMRQAIVPAEQSKNKIFAISVAADYGKTQALIQSTTVKIILSILAMGIGLFMLVAVTFNSRHIVKKTGVELEALKEKNQAMEELNRKTREMAHRQRLETIGTLTSSIAHEFNNLLTPIMGYSMMTLESLDPDSNTYDDVLEIYNASCKAKDIISRLSELSRKNTETVFEVLSPDLLINKVMKMAAPALPKNVDITRDLNCPNKTLLGNDTQLSQLFLNLLINAFQSVESRGGCIHITTKIEDGDNILIVADEGEGISEDIIGSIFDPFFTTKETGKGTGLGLAIAAQAAEAHKGSIQVESEMGKGTTFTVRIPVYDASISKTGEADDKQDDAELDK